MKDIRRFLTILTVVMLVSVLGASFVFAEGEDEVDEDAVTYSVFIYAGKEGYFGKPGVTMKRIDGIKYDQSVTIDLQSMDLKLKDENKYYVRGLKIAGHDNDELSALKFVSYTFNVKEDTAFSVSYGITGGMVKYTVNYEDEDGKKIHKSEDFYGMPGDKPVVAYKLVKGYMPDEYNLTKTLSDNEDENVFTFTYHKVEGSESGSDEEGDEDEDEEGDGDADGANADGMGANNNNGLFFNNGDDNGTADLEDGETPADDGSVTDLDEDETPKSDTSGKGKGLGTGGVVGIVGGGVILALLILFLLRRKKKAEEH